MIRWKNIGLVCMASLVASSAFAGSKSDRIAALEKKVNELGTENAMGNFGVMTSSASPDVNGYGFNIWAGGIYQKASIGGTEFTYTDNDPASSLPIRGRLKEIDFDWDWGFRVGAGYKFEHDNWDVNLWYTYFDSSGSKNVSSGLNGSVIPVRASSKITTGCNNFGSFFLAEIAKSQFDANFHVLNLELGRDYFISGNLTLRPHFGLESVWIDLEQIIRYSGGETADGGLDVNTVRVKDDNDFWGMGPRAGIDSKWFMGYGLNIFGNASAAALYGHVDVDHSERFSLCSADNNISISANTHRIVPTMQLQIGLGWDRYFNNDKQHVRLRIGYDSTYFWRANQFIDVDDVRAQSQAGIPKFERVSEDVMMQGLMFDAKLSF